MLVLGKTLQTGLINKHNLFSFKHYRVKIKFHYYYYYLLCGTILLVQGSFELDDKSQDTTSETYVAVEAKILKNIHTLILPE